MGLSVFCKAFGPRRHCRSFFYWDRPALGTGPLLGQARSWDRPATWTSLLMFSSFLVRHTTGCIFAALFCALWQQQLAATHAPHCWSLHARAKMAKQIPIPRSSLVSSPLLSSRLASPRLASPLLFSSLLFLLALDPPWHPIMSHLGRQPWERQCLRMDERFVDYAKDRFGKITDAVN